MNNRKEGSLLRSIFGWVFSLAFVIMLAYVLVLFFGQTRINVGQSMDPTFSGGDSVLVNTIAYRFTNPKRGDIISFKVNGSTSIKRIIGLPGETVQIVDGKVTIDGREYEEDGNFPAIANPGTASEPVTLGKSEYFVLGDNRNNSEDSRFNDVGMIGAASIEGKVWFILNPSEHRGLLRS